MNVVELFSGSGTIGKAFEKINRSIVFSVDIRKRKGKCEPSLRKDILDLTAAHIPFDNIDVLWASPPCDVWSYASGNFHWNGLEPKTRKCLVHIQILKKTLQLIKDLSPVYFFIENPRGRMRYNKELINFLANNKGMIKSITLSSYGFPTTKPTDIFTNALSWEPKHRGSFGRGAKCSADFDNMTKSQRQKTPQDLANALATFCGKNVQTDNGQVLSGEFEELNP